jgi:hypothetical protein
MFLHFALLPSMLSCIFLYKFCGSHLNPQKQSSPFQVLPFGFFFNSALLNYLSSSIAYCPGLIRIQFDYPCIANMHSLHYTVEPHHGTDASYVAVLILFRCESFLLYIPPDVTI